MKKRKSKASIEEKLKDKNILPTAMRMLTMDFFLEQSSAVTLLDLEKHFHWADRTTLFRTLKTFEKKGLLHSIQDSNTTKYFLCEDDCDENHHHDQHLHFHCKKCGETFCLIEVDFSSVKMPKDYSFEAFKFVAEGICRECLPTMP